MTNIVVEFDTKRLERRLTALERKQLPYATQIALNNTAFKVRGTVQKAMGLYFDRPTPFIVRSVLVEKATKETPVAQVYAREEPFPTKSPKDYLLPHARGGTRLRKRSERLLQSKGVLGPNESIVPTKFIRLTKYGNVPGSTMVRILSQVRAFEEVGFKANITERSRGRSKQVPKYFIPSEATRNRLPRGIYERYGRRPRIKRGPRKGQLSDYPENIRPVLLFVRQPTYRKTFPFDDIVRQDVRRRFRREFFIGLRRALRTAR